MAMPERSAKQTRGNGWQRHSHQVPRVSLPLRICRYSCSRTAAGHVVSRVCWVRKLKPLQAFKPNLDMCAIEEQHSSRAPTAASASQGKCRRLQVRLELVPLSEIDAKIT